MHFDMLNPNIMVSSSNLAACFRNFVFYISNATNPPK